MIQVSCDGWWEQNWFGRQPMENLLISFDAHRIEGSGVDVVGPFVLSGVMGERGAVAIRKQYIDRHCVDYRGVYDGEGSMWGEWTIGADRGRWTIAIRRVAADSAMEIAEFVPGT